MPSPLFQRPIALCLVLLALVLNVAGVSAGTRLRIDDDSASLHIRVDRDAPPVIELQSEDLLPIRWERGTLTEAYLPAIAVRRVTELAIVDDQSVAHALPCRVELPQIVIDAQSYAPYSQWHGQPDARVRMRIVILGVFFSLGLLMVLLVRRHTLVWAALYAGGWTTGLMISLYQAPSLSWKPVHPEVPVRVYYARDPQTVRFTDPSGYWIPFFESAQHLAALNPRIVVRGTDPELLFDLPQAGKLLMTTARHAQDRQESPAR